MKNPSLLFLSLIPLLLVLAVPLPVRAAMRATRLVLLPLAGASYDVECLGDGVYVANSTYQTNLRRVAALLVADAAATRGANYASRYVGYWPNRLLASSFCHGTATTSNSSSCAACIAGAFLEVERACPYHREAYFYSHNCTLQLVEFHIFGFADNIFEETNILKQALASGLIFEAIGFAWLFFLLLQEWRSRKRGTWMHPAPVSSGD